ncbi:MAG: DNA modification methylase [Planctomycetes bacterium]|nr:DNA modification methylase [Planctomycetota bacterium]
MQIRDRVVGLRRVKASDIKPHPRNWRTHGKRQRETLKGVLAEVGFADALLARELSDGSLQLIDGHLRAETTPDMEVPVLVLDLNEEEAAKLLVTLDPLAAMAGSDGERLESLLAEVKTSDEALGRMIRDLARGAGIETDAPLEDDAAPEPPEVAVTQPGDLWLLGEHRLLAGDSTKREDVERLMAGERASLMATDPPYLVDYSGGNHPQSWHNKPDVKDKHWDSYKDPAASSDFFYAFLRLALDVALRESVAIYQWHASRRQALVEEAWPRAGLFVHQQIIWAKTRPILTHSHFMWQHEPCFYGWVEGKPPSLRPDPCLTTVWQIDQKDGESGLHPTMKPLEIFAIPIRSHTRPGEICYEPFSGSGSQIIAAEKLGRRCFAMELEPKFVDAAVSRWQRVAGKVALNETHPERRIY